MPSILPEYHRKALPELIGVIEDSHGNLFKDIDYCAVSAYSGIKTCIESGLAYSKELIHKKLPNAKLVLIDHQVGHIFSSWIGRMPVLRFPMLIFTSSGSHNALIYMRSECQNDILIDHTPKMSYAGAEVFCGLGKVYYIVANNLLLRKGLRVNGNDFSAFNELALSGSPVFTDEILDKARHTTHGFNFLPLIHIMDAVTQNKGEARIEDIACSFKQAFAQLFIEQMEEVSAEYPCAQIHICGGLSNNELVIKGLEKRLGKSVLIPEIEFRYDNAAMIAHAAYLFKTYNLDLKLRHNIFDPETSRINQMYAISIIIPVFGESRTIRKCLRSILNQKTGDTALRYKVILVMDRCKSATEKIIKNFVAKFENLVYIKSSALGVNAARNEGLRAAQSQILVFLDDDCELPDQTWLVRIWKRFSDFPQADAIGGGYELKNKENIFFVCHNKFTNFYVKKNRLNANMTKALLGGNLALRKEVFGDVGYFDEHIVYGSAETEFNERFLKKEKRMYYFDDLSVYHLLADRKFIQYLAKNFKRGQGMAYIDIKHGKFNQRIKFRNKDWWFAQIAKRTQPDIINNIAEGLILFCYTFWYWCGYAYGLLIYKSKLPLKK